MDIASATRIGQGGAAEVYAWGQGRVLKLFRANQEESWVEREYRITAAACDAGLPAPRVHGLERIGGRWGMVLERAEGPSLLQILMRQPWRVLEVGRRLAVVQARIHAARISGLAPAQDRLRWWIARSGLAEAIQREAEAAVARMPAGEGVCHGDLHPDNVVLTRRGPVVIDWSEATAGPPEVDLVRTSILLRYASPVGGGLGVVLNAARRLLHHAWLRRYGALTGLGGDALAPYLLPGAVARAGQAYADEASALRALAARLQREAAGGAPAYR